MKHIQIGEIEVLFTRRVSGLNPTTRLSSVPISADQWFNCAFYHKSKVRSPTGIRAGERHLSRSIPEFLDLRSALPVLGWSSPQR
jgi:hypothetical protein